MQREILFRAKRVDNGEWVFGTPFLIAEEKVCFILNNCSTANFENNDSEFSGFKVHRDTLGQFTGLKDKNGVKVFDGDKILYDEIVGVVFYDDSMFKVRFEYTRSVWMLGELERPIKVIGNIHVEKRRQLPKRTTTR